MDICTESTLTGCIPAISHVKRNYNTWADDLSNNLMDGFDPSKTDPLPCQRRKMLAYLASTFHLRNLGK